MPESLVIQVAVMASNGSIAVRYLRVQRVIKATEEVTLDGKLLDTNIRIDVEATIAAGGALVSGGELVHLAFVDPAGLSSGQTYELYAASRDKTAIALATTWGDESILSGKGRYMRETITAGAEVRGRFFQLLIQGIELPQNDRGVKAEYVWLQAWSDEDGLESVTITYTFHGLTYTTQARWDEDAQTYRAYVPQGVTALAAMTAQTVDPYAQVDVTDNGTQAIHSETEKDVALSDGETTVPVAVYSTHALATGGDGTVYDVVITPVDLSLEQVDAYQTVDGERVTTTATADLTSGRYTVSILPDLALPEGISAKPVTESGVLVRYGYLKAPEMPGVERPAVKPDENDFSTVEAFNEAWRAWVLWQVYDVLRAQYESVSDNYDETYAGITWNDWSGDIAAYEAWLADPDSAALSGVSAGLVWTGWLSPTWTSPTLPTPPPWSRSRWATTATATAPWTPTTPSARRRSSSSGGTTPPATWMSGRIPNPASPPTTGSPPSP